MIKTGLYREKRIARSLLCAVLAAVLLLLSGCSAQLLEVEKLMTPPKATGGKAGIQELLAKQDPKYTMVYPSGGDYRSAIIIREMTGDEWSDALCFCRNRETSGITVYFMRAGSASEWVLLGQSSNAAAQIYKVMFADMDGDDIPEPVICWGDAQSMTATISVYNIEADTVTEYDLGTYYGEPVLVDFDGDSASELFIAGLYTQLEDDTELPALGYVYAMGEQGMEIRYSVEMDNTVKKYSSLLFSRIAPDQYGLLIDGLRADNSILTQAIYLDTKTKRMFSPLHDPDSQTANVTLRSSAIQVFCRDIDGDGIYEIPTVKALQATEEPLVYGCSCCVTWNSLDTETRMLMPGRSMVINATDGYELDFNANWQNSLTVQYAPAEHTMTIHALENDPENPTSPPKVGEALVRIRVFTQAEWESSQTTAGYVKLDAQEDKVFAATIVSSTQRYFLSISALRARFHLWSAS